MRHSLSSHRISGGRAILVVAIILCLSVPVFAQEENPLEETGSFETTAQFRDSYAVHLGTIDVTVLDKDGVSIPGMTREDFVLLVDGQPHDITNFSAYGKVAPPLPELETTTDPADPEPRPLPPLIRPQLLVVFIDNENISRPNRNLILNRLENLVRERLRPPVRMMVVTNDMGLRRVGEVSSNPDEIMQSLQSLVGGTTGATKVGSHTRFAERQIRDLSKPPQTQFKIDQALAAARMNSAQADDAVFRTADTLKTLIRTISGMPGRKDIIYVSDGIPMTPGKSLYLLVDELFRIQQGVQQLREVDRHPLYLQVVAYARAADVTIHAIDATGLQPTHGSNAENQWSTDSSIETVRQENLHEPLWFMTGQTGGELVINSNEMEKGLERIRDATSTYYSLGFPLEAPLSDRVHRIGISLVDDQGYKLRYRTFFREKTVPTQTAERTMTGLLLPVQHNPLGIVAEAGEPRPDGDKRWIVPVKVKSPLGTLTLTPEGDKLVAGLSTFAIAGSQKGATSTVQSSSHRVSVPEGSESKPIVITVDIEVITGAGADTISVGVLDEISGATGFTTAQVAIPK